MKHTDVIKDLNKKADKNKAKILLRFFKTGKGQYGEGDLFLGIVMPEQRKIAKKFQNLPMSGVKKLLRSKYHECRMTALLIMSKQFKENPLNQKKIFDIYISNIKYINNWDLVDISSPNIVGRYLFNKPKDILYKLAKSHDLWGKRISIISTLYFIYQKSFTDTLKISKILFSDKHDLIHKAVGWMLREVGKKDERVLYKFLDDNLPQIPRTTLRYAIEKFPEKLRLYYLKK